MPDRRTSNNSFPATAPAVAGTSISQPGTPFSCRFSALNTVGWVTFLLAQLKHLAIWQGNVLSSTNQSTLLMGWFRDYLWLMNQLPLINGYTTRSRNERPGCLAWMFPLSGHLVGRQDSLS